MCTIKMLTIHIYFQSAESRAPAADSEQYEVVGDAHKQEVMEMQTNAAYASWTK